MIYVPVDCICVFLFICLKCVNVSIWKNSLQDGVSTKNGIQWMNSARMQAKNTIIAQITDCWKNASVRQVKQTSSVGAIKK